MVFWAAILVGAFFVWLAIRLGFFETWGLLFNVVIAIYVAVFLAPIVAACAPSTGKVSEYCMGLSMTVLAGGCFALLHGISYVFLTGQFNVSFPAIFDVLLAGALGFLTGFLIFSFVALIIAATPLAEHELVGGTLGLNLESQKSNIACIAWCCDQVHSIVGDDTDDSATQAAIEQLWGKPTQAPDADNESEPITRPNSDEPE